MTCRVIVAVMLWFALAPAASAAQRRPGFYHLGVGSGPAVTDGKRYVAFPLDDSAVAFYDFGVRSPSELVLRAPPCVELGYPYPSSFDSAGDGEVLWDCVSVTQGPLLEDVATTRVSQLSQPPPGVFGDVDGVYNAMIGTSWIGVWMEDHGVSYPGYYNPASDTWRPEPKSATRYPDLDDPALAHTLCRPLRRSLRPSQDSDQIAAPYEPYFYERPYGVTTRTRIVKGVTYEQVTVQRCGSHKTSVIGRCRSFCSDVQFSDGLVTWADGGTLRAYAPRTRARYTWPPAAIPVAGFSDIRFVHTRQRLIASTPSLTDIRKSDIFAARMPKR